MSGMRSASCDLLVLCGGLGTRLRSVVRDRPKPMAMVDKRPFLDFVLEHFVRHGMERIVLCTGYLSDRIEDWHAGSRRTCEVLISRERSPLGTAGAVRQASRLIRSDPFMVVNGDSLLDVDPNAVLEFHAATSACATVTLVAASARTDVGFVALGPDARITAFAEKQPDSAARYHNAGVYVFERTAVERIPADRPSSIETDLLPDLLSRGVFGYVSRAPLYDIGTPERLAEFQSSRRVGLAGLRSGKRADETDPAAVYP